MDKKNRSEKEIDEKPKIDPKMVIKTSPIVVKESIMLSKQVITDSKKTKK